MIRVHSCAEGHAEKPEHVRRTGKNRNRLGFLSHLYDSKMSWCTEFVNFQTYCTPTSFHLVHAICSKSPGFAHSNFGGILPVGIDPTGSPASMSVFVPGMILPVHPGRRCAVVLFPQVRPRSSSTCRNDVLNEAEPQHGFLSEKDSPTKTSVILRQ